MTDGQKIAVALTMNVSPSQDKIVGYWTLGTPECSDESINWTTAGTAAGWSCTVDGTAYEYADFHILTTDDTNVCDARETYLPTHEGDNKGLFCSHTNSKLRAIFNWNNSSRNIKLGWLVDVEQIGSRTKETTACGAAGETAIGRCAKQLSSGKRAFQYMVGEGGTGVRDLDSSNLDSFEKMFYRAKAFDQNLSGWNTAAVTTIAQMFQEAEKFTNGGDSGIGNWATGNVTSMADAFDRAVLFNHNLPGWDTSEVSTMASMFYGASNFNGSVSSWNTSKVTNMSRMFTSAAVFNQDLSHFNVGLVTDMEKCFWRQRCSIKTSVHGRPITLAIWPTCSMRPRLSTEICPLGT